MMEGIKSRHQLALLVAVLVLSGASDHAAAASFDCSKASSATEIRICENDELSAADEQLAKAYSLALKTAPSPDALKAEQRAWVKNERGKCGDDSCLLRAYQERLALLSPASGESSGSSQSNDATGGQEAKKEAVPAVGGALSQGPTQGENAAPFQQASNPETGAPSFNLAKYEKNGMPCMAELCLGDGLPELEKISWKTLRDYNSVQPTKGQYENMRETYQGDLNPAAVYFSTGTFDGSALPPLGGITVACKLERLRGEYTSPSGHRTEVEIALVPNADDVSKQSWRAIRMRRFLPGLSQTQKASIFSQTRETFKKWDVANARRVVGKSPYGGATFSMMPYEPDWGFELTMDGTKRDIDERVVMTLLERNPNCQSSKPVSID
jgi:uncharacterized protein